MELTRYEQETIINFNEEEKTAGVYTHNKALRRQLDKLAQDRPEDCHREKESHGGQAVSYIVPKSWVKIRPALRLSEAQLAQRRAAAKQGLIAQNKRGATPFSDRDPLKVGKDTTPPDIA